MPIPHGYHRDNTLSQQEKTKKHQRQGDGGLLPTNNPIFSNFVFNHASFAIPHYGKTWKA